MSFGFLSGFPFWFQLRDQNGCEAVDYWASEDPGLPQRGRTLPWLVGFWLPLMISGYF